jgi:predicted AAA+ superfamily ATPase
MPPILQLPPVQLSEAMVRDLWRMNPWWEDGQAPPLPATRRHLVRQMHRRLEMRLAPAVVVRGPRQIGKTTAQLQVVADLLKQGVPPRNIFRVQADQLAAVEEVAEPLLRLADWYEESVLGERLNAVARRGEPTFLVFDEIQNLDRWAPQLKSLVDHSATRVLITGSSALRIEQGRDSLAGRITTIEAGVLSLTEIAAFRGVDLGGPFLADNGLEPMTRLDFWKSLREHGEKVAAARDQTFRWFSERGGYPLVHQLADLDWSHLADQLNETVIRRVIRLDLRSGRGRRRDAALLEELFRLACRYAGQCPGPHLLAREASRTLGGDLGLPKVRQYIRLLADTLLLRLIDPLQIRLKRTQGGAKICLADHGLRASWLQEIVPLDPEGLVRQPHLTVLAGHLAESVLGATLSTISNLDLSHHPGRTGEPEVDFVLTIGTRRIPVEVKYQKKIDPLRDTEGLRTFLEKAANNAPFGLLITQTDLETVVDPRIVALPLSTVMLLR